MRLDGLLDINRDGDVGDLGIRKIFPGRMLKNSMEYQPSIAQKS